jgi:hypothetical protein
MANILYFSEKVAFLGGTSVAIFPPKTSNYTVTAQDGFLLANCTTGAITFTLPPAATSGGFVLYFKKIDSTINAMIIQANGAELIDGSNTVSTIIQYEAWTLMCDGTQWWIF